MKVSPAVDISICNIYIISIISIVEIHQLVLLLL